MENNKTGIELIAQERDKHINKHHQFVEDDVEQNSDYQLANAAHSLCIVELHEWHTHDIRKQRPYNWNEDRWMKMATKPYKERLIIAGALIAAEIDRLNYFENGR